MLGIWEAFAANEVVLVICLVFEKHSLQTRCLYTWEAFAANVVVHDSICAWYLRSMRYIGVVYLEALISCRRDCACYTYAWYLRSTHTVQTMLCFLGACVYTVEHSRLYSLYAWYLRSICCKRRLYAWHLRSIRCKRGLLSICLILFEKHQLQTRFCCLYAWYYLRSTRCKRGWAVDMLDMWEASAANEVVQSRCL